MLLQLLSLCKRFFYISQVNNSRLADPFTFQYVADLCRSLIPSLLAIVPVLSDFSPFSAWV